MAKREYIDKNEILDKAQDYGEGQNKLILIDPCYVRNARSITEQDIVKPYIDKVIDVIEAYICDKEEDTVKAQGMCKALELIEATLKEMSESDEEVCEWIKYDYRTVAPRNHDINNPYWRIPENRMNALKYCPYCGKKIEVKE